MSGGKIPTRGARKPARSNESRWSSEPNQYMNTGWPGSGELAINERLSRGTGGGTSRRCWSITSQHQAERATVKSRQRPGTPFRSCSPRSSNAISDPTTRSLTVEETTVSPASASAMTRAPR